jgi:hypothetical protein
VKQSTRDYLATKPAKNAIKTIAHIVADVNKQPTKASWYVEGAEVIVAGLFESGLVVTEVGIV